MRFRKSITLIKGVRVNFSKSGTSLTVGAKGFSFNFGPKGVYLNTGIPGTGLYDRIKISSTNFSAKSSKNNSNSNNSSNQTHSIHINIIQDENGAFSFEYDDGRPVTDETLIRKMKKTNEYKEEIERMTNHFVKEKEEITKEFVEIYKKSVVIIPPSEIEKQLNSLVLKKYQKQQCNYQPPNTDSIKAEVIAASRRNIRCLFGRKKKQQEYFDEQFPKILEKENNQYLSSVNEFNKRELEREEKINREYEEQFKKERDFLQGYLSGETNYVENNIDTLLQSIILPVDFSISYQYEESTGSLMVDLDLPEIEDLPTECASVLANGKIKIKNKTLKEQKEEYLICVTGLAFFFTSKLFNISSKIDKILISGYTQRINKKSGNIEDQYIYSIIFDREKFRQLNIPQLIPYLAIEDFPYIMNYTSTFELKTINPFVKINDFRS